MHVRCVGAGNVTVVLISGFLDGEDKWSSVTPTLSRRARVCSYARFGDGASDPPPATQTFATEAQDLRTALRSIDEPGPYVLVGHSFGGAEAVTFTAEYPSEVLGLVLLDASPTDWLAASCAVPEDGTPTARVFRDNCASISSPGEQRRAPRRIVGLRRGGHHRLPRPRADDRGHGGPTPVPRSRRDARKPG